MELLFFTIPLFFGDGALDASEQESPAYIEEGVYEGVYTSGFESSGFQLCSADEEWWLVLGDGVRTNDLFPGLDAEAMYLQGEFIPLHLVTIKGRITKNAFDVRSLEELRESKRYGHMGLNNRQVEVTEVISSQVATDEDITRCYTFSFGDFVKSLPESVN